MKKIKQFFMRPYIYLIIVIIGTLLKFYHIGDRYFWLDEIATIAHTTGLPPSDFPKFIPLNEISNIQHYNTLLHLNEQNYKIGKQITGLFSTTNLTPLHYVFLIFWYRIVGDDLTDYRLFSVFIFIITLPLLFMLVKKLFETNLSGWIAVSLFSISPFFHLYAQEARYYILWAFFLILFHLLFLQAITYNKLKWWIGYSIVGILSLYISVFSGIALLGHLMYIWILHKEHRKIHMIYTGLILLFYSPWIHSMFINRKEIFTVMSWQTRIPKVSLWDPIIGQLIVFVRTFVNFNLNPLSELTAGNQSFSILFGLILDICVFGLIITAIIYTFRNPSRNVRLFLAQITLPPILFFYILDIARKGFVTSIARYHVISILGILLFMVYFLYQKIKDGNPIHSFIHIVLVVFGIVSICILSKDRCRNVDTNCKVKTELAQILSNDEKPLIITDFQKEYGMAGLFALIAQCKSDHIDILFASPDIENVTEKFHQNEYSNIYIMYASDKLVQNLTTQFGEKMVPCYPELVNWIPIYQLLE